MSSAPFPRAFYVAGRWSRRSELGIYAEDLRALGLEVTSRWLTDPDHRRFDDVGAQAFNAELARHDVEDVAAADAIVLFEGSGSRGGCHVEFGMALALGKRLFWVGERTHVFSWLDRVEIFPNWGALYHFLSDSVRASRGR